jgi:ADP-ribose pyrophosphatase
MGTFKKTSKDIKWEVLRSKELLRIKSRLTVSVQKLKLPDGRIVEDYHRVIFPDSVVIAAVTKDKEVVMSRQYLHGFGHTSIVLPAGMIDKEEEPFQAAKRELLEETGYASDDWTFLAAPYSHRNYGGGRVNFFLARNARKLSEPDSNDLEEMEIVLLDAASITKNIKRGDIICIASIAGLALAKLYLNAPEVRGAACKKRDLTTRRRAEQRGRLL